MSQANNPILAADEARSPRQEGQTTEPPAASGRNNRVSLRAEGETTSKRPEVQAADPPAGSTEAGSSENDRVSAGEAASRRPEAQVSEVAVASSPTDGGDTGAAAESPAHREESRVAERAVEAGRNIRANPRVQGEARTPRVEAQFTERAADSGRNHRLSPRAAVELDVSLGSDHNFYAGFVENLSAGGVFVATHLLRPVGEVIELSIHISDDDEVIQGTGEVRWIREYNEASDVPPGMGVKFLSLADGAEKAIERFLAQRDPMFFDDDD